MNEKLTLKTNIVEKRIFVSCCDSNGHEFSINYYPDDQTLIFVIDKDESQEDVTTFLFADVDTKDFVELQFLLVTLGEHLTMDIVKHKKLTFVDQIRVDEVPIEFTI